MTFTHLHVASSIFGSLRSDPARVARRSCRSRRATALAVTDRNGLYGAVKHIGACLQLGIDPIVGVDLLVTETDGEELGRVTILAHGNDGGLGWAALCKITSAAHKSAKRKKEVSIDIESLSRLAIHDGVALVTVLLGPESNFGNATLNGNRNIAAGRLLRWRKALQTTGSLGVEIVSHITEPGTSLCNMQAHRMIQIADAMGIPTVLTNAVRYLQPDDALTQMCLMQLAI